MQTDPRAMDTIGRLFDLGLLIASSGAILAVVTWIESGLVG